jgi:hypothetical protein
MRYALLNSIQPEQHSRYLPMAQDKPIFPYPMAGYAQPVLN